MGAEYCSEFIKDTELNLTDAELKGMFTETIEQAEWGHGHSGYSGSFAEKTDATIHRDKVFDDEGLAEDFVCYTLNSDKWGPADIVPVKDKGWYVGGWCSS